MNTLAAKKSLYAIAILSCLLLFTSCHHQQLEQYRERQPQLVPEVFFNGDLTAHGILKNRRGEVIRTFHATIKASWKDGVGTLDERFVFDDGEVQYRTWTLKPREAGGYIATAGDVVGDGVAATSGNAMHLGYVLRIAYKQSQVDISVDDWMYQVDEKTIINESVLSKWGFRVGTIQLAIVRH